MTTAASGSAPAAWPPGLRVRLARRTLRARGSAGDVLVGGSPTTLLRLAPADAGTLADGVVDPARDARASMLADRLLRTGIGVPDARGCPPATDAEYASVAVVVPVRDGGAALDRLLRALDPDRRRGVRVVVVDDGSARPVPEAAADLVLRHDRSRGPAAARNAGARAAGRPVVCFLDADTVPEPGWLGPLLAHLRDERVAAVAPRIVAARPGRRGLAGYETARSALDMGAEAALVRPRTAVAYVPSAALALRPDRLPGGVVPGAPFADELRSGEDVDLCWRLVAGGARVVYEPASRVAHDHRLSVAAFARRRAFYGTSAATLARRHPGLVPPAAFTARMLALAGALWWASPASVLAAAALAAATSRRLSAATGDRRVAARLTAWSTRTSALQLASAAWRPYWPVTAAALAVATRCSPRLGRRLAVRVAAAGVAEGLWHWWDARPPGGAPVDGPVGHVLAHRLDDLAYGAGVWLGAARARSVAALWPEVRP